MANPPATQPDSTSLKLAFQDFLTHLELILNSPPIADRKEFLTFQSVVMKRFDTITQSLATLETSIGAIRTDIAASECKTDHRGPSFRSNASDYGCVSFSFQLLYFG